MNNRDGFYFYRSFWDAVNQLPAKDQLPILKAVILFGLDGTEPDKLTPTQNAFFLLARPNLLKGRNKAASGKKGGSKKKANSKQNESKSAAASDLLPVCYYQDKRLESNPYGLRQGMLDEGVNESATPSDGSLFTVFWNAYPEPAKRRREEAWEAWKKLNPGQEDFNLIMERLAAWKLSKRWLDDDGAFIPNAENFLDPAKGYLASSPPPAKHAASVWGSGELGEAELEMIHRMLREEPADG